MDIFKNTGIDFLPSENVKHAEYDFIHDLQVKDAEKIS